MLSLWLSVLSSEEVLMIILLHRIFRIISGLWERNLQVRMPYTNRLIESCHRLAEELAQIVGMR